ISLPRDSDSTGLGTPVAPLDRSDEYRHFQTFVTTQRPRRPALGGTSHDALATIHTRPGPGGGGGPLWGGGRVSVRGALRDPVTGRLWEDTGRPECRSRLGGRGRLDGSDPRGLRQFGRGRIRRRCRSPVAARDWATPGRLRRDTA